MNHQPMSRWFPQQALLAKLLLHCRLTGPDAGLEEPALGDPAQEATQRRLFTAASSDGPTDFASATLELMF